MTGLLWTHGCEYETSHIIGVILSLVECLPLSIGGVPSRFIGQGVLKDFNLLLLIENNSQVSRPVNEVSPIELVLLKDGS